MTLPSWITLEFSYAGMSGIRLLVATLAFLALLYLTIKVNTSIEAKDKKILALVAELAQMDVETKTLEDSLFAQDTRVAAMEHALENAHQDLAVKTDELENTRRLFVQDKEQQRVYLNAVREEIAGIRGYAARYGEMFQEWREENTGLLRQVVQLESEVLESEEFSDDLEFRLNSMIDHVEELSVSNDILTTDNEDLQHTVQNWIITMRALHAPDSQAEIARLKTELTDLHASHNRLVIANSALKTNMAHSQHLSASNARKAADTETLNRTLTSQHAALTTSLTSTTSQLHTAEHETSTLRAELTDKQHETTRLQNANLLTQSALNASLTSLRNAAAAKDAHIASLQLHLAACAQRAGDQERELEYARYAIEGFSCWAAWEEKEELLREREVREERLRVCEEELGRLRGLVGAETEDVGAVLDVDVDVDVEATEAEKDCETVHLEGFTQRFEEVGHSSDVEQSESNTEDDD